MGQPPGIQPIEHEALRTSLGTLYTCFRSAKSAAESSLLSKCKDERSTSLRDRLFSTELAQLTHDEALWWLHRLYDEKTCAAAFRYVMPRICEALVSDFDNLEFDFWKFCAALPRFKWQEWPPEELAATRAFLQSLWSATIHTRSEVAGTRMTIILYALTLCGENYAQYLAAIHDTADLNVAGNAAVFLLALFDVEEHADEEGAFAWYPAALKKQLKKLLINPEMLTRLRDARQEETNEEVLEQFDLAGALVEHQLWGKAG